jgi:hypothetical protein
MQRRNLTAVLFVAVMMGLGAFIVWQTRHRVHAHALVQRPVSWRPATSAEVNAARKTVAALLEDYKHPPSRLPVTFDMAFAIHNTNTRFMMVATGRYGTTHASTAGDMLSQNVLLTDTSGRHCAVIYYLSRRNSVLHVIGVAPDYPQPGGQDWPNTPKQDEHASR